MKQFGYAVSSSLGLVMHSYFVVVCISILLLPLNVVLAEGGMCGETCNYYISPEGNDATGNGSSANPWKTVQHTITSSSSSSLTVCLANGNYSESISINSAKVETLSIQGRTGFPLLVDVSYNMYISTATAAPTHSNIYLCNLQTGWLQIQQNDSSSYLNELFLENVQFYASKNVLEGRGKGSSLPQSKFYLRGKTIKLTNCNFSSSYGAIVTLNTSVPTNSSTKIEINQLIVDGTTDLIFQLDGADNVSISNSIFTNNNLTNYNLLNINSTSPLITLENVTFAANRWNSSNTPTLVSVPPTSAVNILSCVISCNDGMDSSSKYPPIISPPNNSTVIDLQVTSTCPIHCLTNPNPVIIQQNGAFSCLPCDPGDISINSTFCHPCDIAHYVLNNTCTVCPPGTFSDSNLPCTNCPSFSSQSSTGSTYCVCFTGSRVSADNLLVCKNEFWGIIVGVVYVILIGGIVLYWVRKSRGNYDVIVVK